MRRMKIMCIGAIVAATVMPFFVFAHGDETDTTVHQPVMLGVTHDDAGTVAGRTRDEILHEAAEQNESMRTRARIELFLLNIALLGVIALYYPRGGSKEASTTAPTTPSTEVTPDTP